MEKLFLYLDKKNDQFNKWADSRLELFGMAYVLAYIFIFEALILLLPFLLVIGITGDVNLAVSVMFAMVTCFGITSIGYLIWLWNDIFNRGN